MKITLQLRAISMRLQDSAIGAELSACIMQRRSLPLGVLVRKAWLARAIRDYPVYDPPHKIEERLLTKELAMENFEYFIDVRLARLSHFREWLSKNFSVRMTLDRKGVKALNQWGNKYAGLVFDKSNFHDPAYCYFTYNPAWIGTNIGCNVVFDMGIALGEAMIAQCPNLHWAFDKSAEYFPRTTDMIRRSVGTSFQRPRIYGYQCRAWSMCPLHSIQSFSFQMRLNIAAGGCISRFLRDVSANRRNRSKQLLSEFDAALRYYPIGDPNYLSYDKSFSEYLSMIDQNNIEGN